MNLLTDDLRRNSKTSMSIAQELRTVGQGLESLAVDDFDLQREGDGYFALGIPHHNRAHATTLFWSTLRSSCRSITGKNPSTLKLLEAGPGVLRILFTTEGILKLEAAGITRRNPNSASIPDFTQPAQSLRMVGEHIEAESARLLAVSKRGDRIAFGFISAADHRTEEWRLSHLYGRWLETYKHRRDIIRASGQPLSFPQA